MKLPPNLEMRPDVMMGKPCIEGTRIPAYLILQKMAAGETQQTILSAYPQLRPQHLQACLQYAAGLASEEIIFSQA